jgi:apolipoprotein D and lipocalin family protein
VRFAPGWLGWLPMVWADYWVVDLDPDYQWAVVGGPGQGAMWILARETTLDPALFERIRQRAEARGYRLAELVVDPAQRDRMVAE